MSPSISLSSFLSAFLSCQALFSSTSYAQTVTGKLGNAVRVLNNPQGAGYVAEMVQGPVKGSILAISAGKRGTDFAVNFQGLPAEGGPFIYHIHVAPVPADGNCTSTLAHLDPYIRGEDTPCQANRPDTCQVGDLAGKHGTIQGTAINASYSDPYVSLIDGQGAFFGNRSIVIHFANKTRLACANFQSVENALVDGPIPGMPTFPSGAPGLPSGGPPGPSGLPSILPPGAPAPSSTFIDAPPGVSTIYPPGATATGQAAKQEAAVNNSANGLHMPSTMILMAVMATVVFVGWS